MTKVKAVGLSVLVAICLLLPLVISSRYWQNVLIMSLIFVLFATSWNMAAGFAGIFTFGHAAFFAIGAYGSALMSVRLGVSAWVGLLTGIGVAGLVAFVVGVVCLRRRGIYLAIITLCISEIVYFITGQWRSLTFGATGVLGVPRPVLNIPLLPKIVFSSELAYYYLLLILVGFTICLTYRYRNSRFGRALIGVSEDYNRACSLGINPFIYQLGAFCISCMLAGLSGGVYAYYLGIVVPEVASISYMVQVCAMVIVGGIGTIGGPIMGAIVLGAVPESLRIVGAFRMIIFGAIVLICIMLLPRGMYPPVKSVFIRLVKPLLGSVLGESGHLLENRWDTK